METFKKYSSLVLNEIFYILEGFYEKYGQCVLKELEKMKFDDKLFVKDFAEWIVQYCDMDFSKIKWAKNISSKCIYKKIYGDLSQKKQYIQAVIDFMAGMTDVYAINAFEELLQC